MKKYILLYKILFLSLPGITQIQIGTGAYLKTSGNVSLAVNDLDLENNGSFIQTSGSIIFSGSQNSFIRGSNVSMISNLQLNKTNNSQLALNNHINIGNTVNFISGLLDLNGNNILMNGTANIIGESETSRIIGPNGGYVEINQLLNTPSTANPGNLGAIITSPSNMGIVTIRRGHLAQSGNGLSSSINRYFNIIPATNNNLDATLRIKYFDAELNGQPEEWLGMYQTCPEFDNGLWINLGFTSVNAFTNFVEYAGLNSLCKHTLSQSIFENPNRSAITNNSTPEQKLKTVIRKKLTVGPNPNNGNFWFTVSGIEKETAAGLYTLDGKLMKTFKVVNQRQQFVSGLRSGLYLLKVQGMETVKVIVQGSSTGAPVNTTTESYMIKN
jgi:hypothetical protein